MTLTPEEILAKYHYYRCTEASEEENTYLESDLCFYIKQELQKGSAK